jgi:hypothetical protein
LLYLSVGYVSRFMEAPTEEHQAAVKRILHYVAGPERRELEQRALVPLGARGREQRSRGVALADELCLGGAGGLAAGELGPGGGADGPVRGRARPSGIGGLAAGDLGLGGAGGLASPVLGMGDKADE